jgi:hypothetical protein
MIDHHHRYRSQDLLLGKGRPTFCEQIFTDCFRTMSLVTKPNQRSLVHSFMSVVAVGFVNVGLQLAIVFPSILVVARFGEWMLGRMLGDISTWRRDGRLTDAQVTIEWMR